MHPFGEILPELCKQLRSFLSAVLSNFHRYVRESMHSESLSSVLTIVCRHKYAKNVVPLGLISHCF